MLNPIAPFAVQFGEGPALETPTGGAVTVKADTSSTNGRLLMIGLERFFEQFAALLPGPVDSETLVAVGHANWVEFVGPPVAVSDPL